MIDTIFFLLVFFMVASLSMIHQEGLTVELPRAATSARAVEQRVTITVRENGDLFLNKQRVSREALPQALRQLLARAPNSVVIVNADRGARLGAAVDVMDAARLAGASQASIATEPKEH
jgi:biopolymer transport protein ExbD